MCIIDFPDVSKDLKRNVGLESVDKHHIKFLKARIKELEKKNAKQYEALQDLADTLAEFQKEKID